MINTKSAIVLLVTSAIVLQSLSLLWVKYATLTGGVKSIALLALALGCILTRAVIWQTALKRASISKIYPANALVQVLVFFYAIVLFDEQAKSNNIIGLVVMLAGVYLLSKDSD